MVVAKALNDYMPTQWIQRPNWIRIKEILTVGVPVGLTFFLETGVFSVIALLVGTLGDNAIAAHQIAFNIWDVFYIPMISVGSAMATRIGHAIGAMNIDGVRLAIWVGTGLSFLIGLTFMIVLTLLPEEIVGAYTRSPDITGLALQLLRLASFFILIDVFQIVGSFILRAYKETRFPFIVITLSYWGVALPLGFLLGIHWGDSSSSGTIGFWYAIIIGISLATVLITWRVREILHRLDHRS